jgi:ABC-type glycerol-3-phosphate transport system permease component
MVMNTTNNHAHEKGITYAGAVPHTLFTVLIWIIAGFLAVFSTPAKAILFSIMGGTLIFPGGELIRKSFLVFAFIHFIQIKRELYEH